MKQVTVFMMSHWISHSTDLFINQGMKQMTIFICELIYPLHSKALIYSKRNKRIIKLFTPAYSNAHFSQFIKSTTIKSNLAIFSVDVWFQNGTHFDWCKSAFSNEKKLVSVWLYALRASLRVSAELVSKTSVHVDSELHSQTQEGKQHFIFSFNTVCSYQTVSQVPVPSCFPPRALSA